MRLAKGYLLSTTDMSSILKEANSMHTLQSVVQILKAATEL